MSGVANVSGPVPGLRFATHAEYYAWVEAQPRGRFERLGGEVYAMAAERGPHLRAKAATWLALREAIRASGVPCQALPDGVTIEIGPDCNYEPDATVNCGSPMGEDDLAAPNPIIVVEVLSPKTRSIDNGRKLVDYFRVPSIEHYLMVLTDRRVVVHHRRGRDATIETRVLASGPLLLDPPALTVAVEQMFEA